VRGIVSVQSQLRNTASAPRVAKDSAGASVVIFDLDGTLINTMPILADLAAEIMSEVYELPGDRARALYLSSCGIPFFQQLESIFPGDERNAGCAARFEAAKPALCGAARMTSDTVEALRTLQQRGIKVAVSSNNGQENVDLFTRANDFDFDLTLGFGAGMWKGKPHFDQVERALGVKRSDMVFVGDSIHDGEVAASEKVRFVGVSGTFARERFQLRFPEAPVVRRIAELLPLL
jgi:phosphoglycolate phosphatase-like HAD superfamily hydrolase